MTWLINLAFTLLLAGWTFLIGVGLSSDVLRWLRSRQGAQKPANDRGERLGVHS